MIRVAITVTVRVFGFGSSGTIWGFGVTTHVDRRGASLFRFGFQTLGCELSFQDIAAYARKVTKLDLEKQHQDFGAVII